MLTITEKLVHLSSLDSLEELGFDELLPLAEISREIVIPADRSLTSGQSGTLLLILEGRVELQSDETVLSFGPGEMLGALEMLGGSEVEVKAAEDCRALSIEGTKLSALLRAEPELSLTLLVGLTRELRNQA